MEKLYNELRTRTPLFFSMLSAAGVNSRSRSRAPHHEVLHAGTAMAAAVLLRNRSKFMIAVQLVVTIFLYHSNWLSAVAWLSALRLTTSHKYLYKKLDEFGQDHTKHVTDAILLQGKFMEQQQQREGKKQHATFSDTANEVTTGALSSQLHGYSAVTPTESHAAQAIQDVDQILVEPDYGRKITFDNLDFRQEVHYMTEDRQNIDKHHVTSMSTENHVSGNHLSGQHTGNGVLAMENGKCLPSILDHA